MYGFAKATRFFPIQGVRAFAKWVLPRPSPPTGRNLDESPVEGRGGGGDDGQRGIQVPGKGRGSEGIP